MSEQVKLNLGCGIDIRPDFTNIDIQSFPGVNKVQDAIVLSDIADESVDFIVAQHFLEYIPRFAMVTALSEWLRVLKKNAALEIRVTDLSKITQSLYLHGISDEMGLHHEMVISMLYGKQKDQYDIRYNGFTSDFLQGVLVGLGYNINYVVSEGFDVIITAVKK
jgi:predicted SAM-dependent methyltransferase